MRICVDGEGDGGVPQGGLDDGRMHVGRQKRGGERMTESMQRPLEQPGLINDSVELMTQLIGVYRRTVIHSEDIVGLLPRRASLEPHLNLSSLHRL